MAGLGRRVRPLFELEAGVYQSAELQVHNSQGDWAGVYNLGKLVYQGHTDDVYHWVLEALGVEEVYDDAFMKGQQRREGVAQTLDEVEAYRHRREFKRAEAKRLREDASAMVAKAAELEKEAVS